MTEKDKEKPISRRNSMKTAIVVIGGIIGGAIGLPVIPYIIGPAQKQDTGNWIRLGPISKVELNTPTLFKTTIKTQTGWINSEEEFSAFVLTTNGQEYIAMSNICTHLGCRIRWIPDKESYFCPCHNGVFSIDGQVLSGPPPRPLDRFENKIEDGVLYVKRG